MKEDIAIEYQLDKMAPFVKDFPYEDEIEIKRAGEARIYKVRRITDGKTFAAKMRFNPALRPDLD